MSDAGPLKQDPALMSREDAAELIKVSTVYGLDNGGAYGVGSVAHRALLTVVALHNQINEAGAILSPGALFQMSGDGTDGGEEVPTTLKERAEMVVMALSAEAQEATRANGALASARRVAQQRSKEISRLRAEVAELKAGAKPDPLRALLTFLDDNDAEIEITRTAGGDDDDPATWMISYTICGSGSWAEGELDAAARKLCDPLGVDHG